MVGLINKETLFWPTLCTVLAGLFSQLADMKGLYRIYTYWIVHKATSSHNHSYNFPLQLTLDTLEHMGVLRALLK